MVGVDLLLGRHSTDDKIGAFGPGLERPGMVQARWNDIDVKVEKQVLVGPYVVCERQRLNGILVRDQSAGCVLNAGPAWSLGLRRGAHYHVSSAWCSLLIL